MSKFLGLILLPLLLSTLVLNSTAKDPSSEGKKEVNEPTEEMLHINFLKVLSAMLVRKTGLPAEIKESAKVVMRELLNGQPRREGYMSYLYESMLRVVERPAGSQMVTMLSVMEEQSPNESLMSRAAGILRDWLQTPAGKAFIESLANYVRNLFEWNRKYLPRVPGSQLEKEPGDKPNKPVNLPASIEDRTALSSRLTKFKYVNERPGPGISINLGLNKQRHPAQRPGGDRYPENGNGRYPDRPDYYPEDRPGRYPENRPGHYPEDRPQNHPRPGGGNGNYPGDRPGQYPEDRPHNHPRPGGGGENYPGDRPNRPGQYPEDRPHNHPGQGNYPEGGYPPGGRPHGKPIPPNRKPAVDKVCIERIPGNFRARRSLLGKY